MKNMGGVPFPPGGYCVRAGWIEKNPTPTVIPAKAGIQGGGKRTLCAFWIPAFAGMTVGSVREEVLAATERRLTARISLGCGQSPRW